MKPAELAGLLADLGCRQQHELLAALDTEHAARALSHLDTAHLRFLLRGIRPDRAALLASRLDRAARRGAPYRPRRWPWHRPGAER